MNFLDRALQIFKWLFCIAASLTIIYFVYMFLPAVIIHTGKEMDFGNATGTIGDTIGGALGPLIGLVGAILTFFAFYIQYEANQQQRIDLIVERFESKFFEMLRLHKENVNELSIDGYEVSKKTTVTQGTTSVSPIEETTEKVDRLIAGRRVFLNLYNELLSCHDICKAVLASKDFLGKERYLIKLSYQLVFAGVKNNLVTKIDKNLPDDKIYIDMCKKALAEASYQHYGSYGQRNTYVLRDLNKEVHIPVKYRPFVGHTHRLGHYYRNLYTMVKFVASQDKKHLSFDQKREYLKILRAQLTSQEQLMLYFNYLSEYGRNWESDKNAFFSDYKMIHNLPIEMTSFTIDPRVEFATQIKKLEKKHEAMFEYDE